MSILRNSAWPFVLVFTLLAAGLYHLEGRMGMHDTHPRTVRIRSAGAMDGTDTDVRADTTLARVLKRTQHLEDSSGSEAAAAYLLAQSLNFRDSVKAYLQFKAGQAYMNAGHDSLAIAALEKSLQVGTRSVDAELCLNLLKASGESTHEDRIASIESFIRRHPGYVPAHFRLGLIHQRHGDLQTAAEAYRRVLELYPPYKEARWNLGLILYQTHQYRAAREEFQFLARTNKWKGEYHFNLARTLTHLGEKAEALQSYARALSAKGGNYPEAYYNMASLHHDAGRSDSAMEVLKKAVRLRPSYAEAWYNLGLYSLEADENEQAAAFFRRACEIRPDYREGFYNLGLAYSRSGKRDSSVWALSRAVEASPGYHKAREALVERLVELGRDEALMRTFAEGVRTDPRRADWWFELAELRRVKGRNQGAIEAYQKMLALEPNHEIALNNLGLVFAREQRRKEAAAIFEEGLTRYPESITMRYNLALQYRMLRKYKTALKHLGKAERLDGGHLSTLRLKATVLEKLKRYDKALATCEKVLELEPDNESFQKRIQRLEKKIQGRAS